MSNAAVFLGNLSVSVAAAGALGGNGLIGNPLTVEVDNDTITINGSNQLASSGGTPGSPDTSVQFNDGGALAGALGLRYDASAKALRFTGNLPGVTAPVTLEGGDDSFGSAALVVNNADDFAVIRFAAYPSLSFPTSGGDLTMYHAPAGLARASIAFEPDVSGAIELATYGFAGVSNSGDISLQTLDPGGTGDSGNLIFNASTVAGGGTRGHITFGGLHFDFTGGPVTSDSTIKAAGYKSSDGSAGVTAGPFTAITSITVKNGLITAITGA